MLLISIIKGNIDFIRKMNNPNKITRAVIETASVCNYKCPFCWTTESIRKKGLLNLETFYKIVDDLKELKIREITLSHGGEPLLNKDLFTMIKTLKNHNYYVSITTNGALLDEEKSKKLIESNIDRIEISFHANNAKTYLDVFNQNNYDLVLENVKALFKLRKENKKPEIKINNYLMDTNATEYFNKKHPLKDFSDSINEWAIINSDSAKEKTHSPIPINKRNKPCMWIVEQINILSNGDITLGCCIDGNANLLLGNIHEKSIINLITSKPAQIIKNIFLRLENKKNNYEKFSQCRYCFDEIQYRKYLETIKQ